jgi:transposase
MIIPHLTFEKDRRRKLSREQLEEMPRIRKEGMSYQAIADKYEVSISTIYEHLNPEKYIEKRRIKIQKRTERYRNDILYREKRSKASVEHKQYKRAVMNEIEDQEIETVRDRFRKLRKLYDKEESAEIVGTV